MKCVEFLLNLVEIETGLCYKYRFDEVEVIAVKNSRLAPRSDKWVDHFIVILVSFEHVVHCAF